MQHTHDVFLRCTRYVGRDIQEVEGTPRHGAAFEHNSHTGNTFFKSPDSMQYVRQWASNAETKEASNVGTHLNVVTNLMASALRMGTSSSLGDCSSGSTCTTQSQVHTHSAHEIQ